MMTDGTYTVRALKMALANGYTVRLYVVTQAENN